MTDFQTQRLQFAANPEKFIADHMANQHMWEDHELTSKTKMLNNVLKPGRYNGKYGDSQFRRVQNADLGADCVRDCLIKHFDAITRYVTQYHDNPEGLSSTQLYHMEFTSTRPDGQKIPNYVGMGYRLAGATSKKFEGEITGIEAVKTNAVACIIRPTKTNPDGWEITSAFPMVTPRQTEITDETSIQRLDKDFEYQLHKTITYQNADPIMQAYLDTACSGKPVDPKYRIVYSPKTDKRPPMITICKNNKNPENKSNYPMILLYANPNPPANATLLLNTDKKVRMGGTKSMEDLKNADPKMAEIYEAIIEKIPEEFRPVEKPVSQRRPENRKPKAPETRPASRKDPHFDNLAAEIERSATDGQSIETQLN